MTSFCYAIKYWGNPENDPMDSMAAKKKRQNQQLLPAMSHYYVKRISKPSPIHKMGELYFFLKIKTLSLL